MNILHFIWFNFLDSDIDYQVNILVFLVSVIYFLTFVFVMSSQISSRWWIITFLTLASTFLIILLRHHECDILVFCLTFYFNGLLFLAGASGARHAFYCRAYARLPSNGNGYILGVSTSISFAPSLIYLLYNLQYFFVYLY